MGVGGGMKRGGDGEREGDTDLPEQESHGELAESEKKKITEWQAGWNVTNAIQVSLNKPETAWVGAPLGASHLAEYPLGRISTWPNIHLAEYPLGRIFTWPKKKQKVSLSLKILSTV